MTNYIAKRIQDIFRCVFEGILAFLVSGPKSATGLLLVFVEIMPDTDHKIKIIDHKMSYLVSFENFHFFVIFSLMANIC